MTFPSRTTHDRSHTPAQGQPPPNRLSFLGIRVLFAAAGLLFIPSMSPADVIVFTNGRTSPEGRISRDVEGEPTVTFYTPTQGETRIPRTSIAEIRRSTPGGATATQNPGESGAGGQNKAQQAELLRRNGKLPEALSMLSDTVRNAPGQPPSRDVVDTYVRVALDLQGRAKMARTEAGKATDADSALPQFEASRTDYRALYAELAKVEAGAILGSTYRRLAATVAEELTEVSLALANILPDDQNGRQRKLELIAEAAAASPGNNQIRWRLAEAALGAGRNDYARQIYQFLVSTPGVEKEWADASRTRLAQLNDSSQPAPTPIPTRAAQRPTPAPTPSTVTAPSNSTGNPAPATAQGNAPAAREPFKWSDLTRPEKLAAIPGQLLGFAQDLGLDSPPILFGIPAFLGIFWGIPWLYFSIRKRMGDDFAYDASRHVLSRGIFAFIPYFRGLMNRPKIRHRCPHCANSLDNIETFQSLNFVVCPHCRENISPVYNLGDYIQHLVKQVQLQANRNISTVSGTSVIERDAMTKLLRAVITMAVRQRASDLMVETEADALKVRARVDGVMYDLQSLPRNVANPFISAIKVATNLDITEKRVPQDGKFTLSVDDQSVDLRVNTSPSPQGERATIRLLTHKTLRLEPAKLGLEGRDLEIFGEAIHRPHGLLIVTGPTGSGKSTTLYVALNELNRGDKNIVTIEDPIEYQIKGISQMQVNVAQNFTFATGLRSMLRQGPDIIMVGEIRDQETASIAIEAAATGHLVFTTLHTIDSPTAFTRLADLGIETRRMASAIACIIAQRLCRVVCPDCLTPYTPPPDVLMKLGLIPGTPGANSGTGFGSFGSGPAGGSGSAFGGGSPLELSASATSDASFGPNAGNQAAIHWRGSDTPLTFVKGAGCPTCMSTGFHGRVGIFEFLVPNDAIREAIENGSSAGNIRELARKNGMRTLREAGIDRIAASITSPEEILRVTAT